MRGEILFIVDDERTRKALRLPLEEEQYRVVEAARSARWRRAPACAESGDRSRPVWGYDHVGDGRAGWQRWSRYAQRLRGAMALLSSAPSSSSTSDVSFIDSAALAVLVSGNRRVREGGATVAACSDRGSVRRVLETVGVGRVVAMVPTVDDAQRLVTNDPAPLGAAVSGARLPRGKGPRTTRSVLLIPRFDCELTRFRNGIAMKAREHGVGGR